MKIVLTALVLVSAALATPVYEPVQLNYHEAVGIPKAARIKAAEAATDFDGSRIVGGSPARLGQFPYMGGLIIILQSGATSVCGSSLLSSTRLLTAAHCWFDGRQNARTLTAVLGSILLFTGGTRVVSNRVVVHPNYNPWNLANDLAMISISPVTFTSNIRPINLATGSATFAGQTATAAGFGLIRDGVPVQPNQFLSFVNLPVITNAQCQGVFGASTVIASTLCTWGRTGSNICSSDSGGPLVIGNLLIGVTSFGSARCETNFPAGYARVTSFVTWIRQHM